MKAGAGDGERSISVIEDDDERATRSVGPRLTRWVDPFLEAKLHHPALRAEWVTRARLTERLDLAGTRPVTLIAAPAGYGKTILAAQWIAARPGRVTAWVSLDPGDNDAGRLWTHVATALARAGCPVREGPVDDFVSANIDAIQGRVLPSLVTALAGMPDDIFLVLDDFHCLSAPAGHAQVEFLLEHLPPQAHVVILTRADPGLRLGRLRASGQLLEIRARDLAFNVDEVAQVMASGQVALSRSGVTELFQRTEGWPAGIYLACLWLSGAADPDDVVHRFSGGNRFIGDYLTEEVLNLQRPENRDFIVTMSFLERFSAQLCDHVAETTGSAAILHELARSNLFLIPLDEDGEWFRFHHLFAAVASGELEAQPAARVERLHARAAEWFQERGHIDEAIRHWLAAGEPAAAGALVQAYWLRYVDAGRAATVRGWLDAVGSTATTSDPASAVTAAWMAALFGDGAGLRRLLAELEEVEDYGPLPDGIQSVGSAIAMIQGLFGYGGPVEMAAAAQRAVELETDGLSPFYSMATLTLGHAAYVSGNLDSAAVVLAKAAYNEAAPSIIKALSLAFLSIVEGERGRHGQSSHLAGYAMELVDANRLRAMPQASPVFTALGLVQAADGNLGDAMTTMEEGLILRRRNPEQGPWGVLHHLLAYARVALEAGDLTLAQGLTDEVATRISRFPDGMESMAARLLVVQDALRTRFNGVAVADPLTSREVDVLRLLQGPLSLTDIARELYVSANTVKTHANAVYRKLGAHSRAEAVRLGRESSLI